MSEVDSVSQYSDGDTVHEEITLKRTASGTVLHTRGNSGELLLNDILPGEGYYSAVGSTNQSAHEGAVGSTNQSAHEGAGDTISLEPHRSLLKPDISVLHTQRSELDTATCANEKFDDSAAWDYHPEISVDPTRLPEKLAKAIRPSFLYHTEAEFEKGLKREFPNPSNAFLRCPKWDPHADKLIINTGGKPAEVRKSDDLLKKNQEALWDLTGPLMASTKLAGSSASSAMALSATWKSLGQAFYKAGHARRYKVLESALGPKNKLKIEAILQQADEQKIYAKDNSKIIGEGLYKIILAHEKADRDDEGTLRPVGQRGNLKRLGRGSFRGFSSAGLTRGATGRGYSTPRRPFSSSRPRGGSARGRYEFENIKKCEYFVRQCKKFSKCEMCAQPECVCASRCKTPQYLGEAGKLEKVDQKLRGTGDSQWCESVRSGQCKAEGKMLCSRKRNSAKLFKNLKREGNCKSSSDRRGSNPLPSIPEGKTGWITQGDSRSKKFEYPPHSGKIQNGKFRDGHGDPKGRGLYGKSRSKRCIFLSRNTSGLQETVEIQGRRNPLGISENAKRIMHSSSAVHKTAKTCNISLEITRNTTNNISGRHLDMQPGKRYNKRTRSHSVKLVKKARIHNKCKEISTRTNSRNRISGVHNKINTHDNKLTMGKKEKPRELSKKITSSKEGNTETISSMDWKITSCRKGNTGSKIAFKKNPIIHDTKAGYKFPIGEKRDKKEVQQAHKDNPSSAKRSSMVGKEYHADWTSKNKRSQGLDNHGQRCIPDRLGGSVSRGSNSGNMVDSPSIAPYKPIGVDSSNKNYKILYKKHERSCSGNEDRQQNSDILHKQERGHKIDKATDLSSDFLGFSDREESDCESYISPKQGECSSGLVIQEKTGSQGMDVEQTHFLKITNKMGNTSGRPICIGEEQSGRGIHILEMGKECPGNRCIQPGLEPVESSVCIPRLDPNRESIEKTRELQNDKHDLNSTSLDNSNMVPSNAENVGGPSKETPGMGRHSNGSIQEQPPSSGKGVSKSGGLEGFRKRLRTQGFSEQVTNLVEKKWKKSSRATYESSWKGWNSWCSERNIDPHEPPITEVANYLTHKASKGLSYDALNVSRSAISAFAKPIGNTPLGQHDIIVGLMKGCYNMNPPRPRYTATWCIDTVLDHWRNRPDNWELDLKELSIKTVTLIAISQLKRAHEINNMMLENYAVREKGLEFILKETPKQQRRGSLKPLKINRINQDKIDPVSCILEYIERTKEAREREDGIDRKALFLSISKLHRPITTSTISNWIKQGMDRAGIDTSTYRPHSIRSATVSTVNSKGISLKAILKRGQWKSKSVLKKYYLRDI